MRDRLVVRRWLAALALACAAGYVGAQSTGDGSRPSFAQPEAKIPTVKVEAKLVNVPVVVRDKKGVLVNNLTKDDFALTVDNKAQAIRYFDRDTDLPLTLGLLVDTSGSMVKALDEERSASGSFLDTMLQPQRDRAFVIEFAKQVELLQDLTDSRPKLQAALKAIDVEPRNSQDDNGNNGSNGGRPSFGGGGGTTLYDGVFLASDELMSKQTGRKALVVMSDGEDRGSKENLTAAIEAAQRADTIIYAIYFKGNSPSDNNSYQRPMGGGHHGGMGGGGYPGGGGGYPGGGGGNRGGGGQTMRVDGKKVMQRMADETGGRLFEMTKKQTADDIYKQIAEELRSQYRLAFTPDAETAADGYHQIDLALKVKDAKTMSIQTRDGYYTGK